MLPVEDKRARHDHQRGLSPLAPGLLAPRLQEGQDLYGLAEAHVVGQAAAETEALEKMKPAKTRTLVAPQLAAEPLRFAGRPYAREADQLPASLLENLIADGLRVGGEKGVQQSDLAAAESEMILCRLSETRKGCVFPEPLLGQDPETTVTEDDRVLPAPEGGEKLGQPHVLVLEHRRAMQLEPVDAGSHLDPEVPGSPVKLPLGLDMPALLHEGPSGGRKGLGRQGVSTGAAGAAGAAGISGTAGVTGEGPRVRPAKADRGTRTPETG